ncbi:hypothetical protein R3P38DRAFT_2529329, partial [Favolaschia claudopus]
VYVAKAEKYDNALVESWKSNMDALGIFAGLFSVPSTILLTQNDTILDRIFAPHLFIPATSSLTCNLLFVSLGLSLSCAFIATLVGQWARSYIHETEMRNSPVIRAPIIAYLYSGLNRFNMRVVVEVIPFLLYLSLILFAGLMVSLSVFVSRDISLWFIAEVAISTLVAAVGKHDSRERDMDGPLMFVSVGFSTNERQRAT